MFYPIEKNGLIVRCCECKKIKVKDENGIISFVEMDVPEGKKATDTYYRECYDQIMKIIASLNKKEG